MRSTNQQASTRLHHVTEGGQTATQASVKTLRYTVSGSPVDDVMVLSGSGRTWRKRYLYLDVQVFMLDFQKH